MTKKIIIITAIAGLFGLTLIGATRAKALGLFSNDSTMVANLAQKLGLSEDKVSQAFTNLRIEHQAQREADYTVQLDQLVKDGKITSAQKDLITKKHAELQARRTELQAWATQNGINLQYLNFGMREGHGGRGSGGFGGGW